MNKILSFIFVLSFSMPVLAMTCMTEKIKKRFKEADFVFEATVMTRQKLNEEIGGICSSKGELCGPKIATVEIGEVWKGEFKSNQTTVFSDDGCNCLGTYFPVGSKYVVFGKKSDSNEYELDDLGACWTESYEEIEKKSFKQLNKLKKKANK